MGIVLVGTALVELTRNSYEPDICYFGPAKAVGIKPDLLYYPAPDLVVEVLSNSTQKNDREIKFEDYATHQVAEYWLVDPTRQTVEVFGLNADTEAYALVDLLRVGQTVCSQQLAGFTIPVKAIFDAAANVDALRTLLTASR